MSPPFLIEDESLESGEDVVSLATRFLKKASYEEPDRSDYSIMSVAVMTLGLIMIIELLRHRLDHAAMGKPFFTAVLQGVYAELSTLGLVELFIWILLTYWETINIPKEKVFAKVHFTLFYTAVFNAFQTVVVAFFSTRVSETMWVQTEALELNHYVEIREEFERVQRELLRLRSLSFTGGVIKRATTLAQHQSAGSGSTSSDDPENRDADSTVNRGTMETEDAVTFSRQGFTIIWNGLADRIRYPHLKARYNALLLQVRFHELRVHFLQAYDLPLKFKVSDYLIRSEQQVLIHLVHVSTFAWLLLAALINILYFAMGIVTWESGDPTLVGTSLTWIFFAGMAAFILITWLVYNKMKQIFKTIMHEKTLWNVHTDNTGQVRDDLAKSQRSLFWGGDPNLVIAAIQFMQFGYAVALAVVLIFWDSIKKGDVTMFWYLVGIFGCYTVFVMVTAQLLPRFTLCTSLGQLVNRRRLQEAAALYHLEEEKQRRLELEQPNWKEALVLQKSLRSFSMMSSRMLGMDPVPVASAPVAAIALIEKKKVATGDLIANLVRSDTDSLRSSLPDSEREQLSRRENQRSNRRMRKKAMSEGVSSMMRKTTVSQTRAWDDSSDLYEESVSSEALSAHDTQVEHLRARRVRHEERRKASSDGASTMPWNNSTSVNAEEEKAMELDDLKPLEVRVQHGKIQEYDDEDGHSDVDDVPEADPSMVKATHSLQYVTPPTLKQTLREYYLGKQYMSISHVFGTLFAFFFVGQRIERFLHTDGVVGNDFVSFDFDNPITFWAFTFWLLMFLLNDGLILLCLKPDKGGYRAAGRKERKILTSASLDILLSSVCLAIFFVAEGQRCCESDGNDTIDTGLDDVFRPASCECPVFGSRLYGGLGNIEPYISLIGLRLFRRWLAKQLLWMVDMQSPNAALHNKDHFGSPDDHIDPFDVFGGQGHEETEENRTPIEMWQTAIGKYPDIVAKYGEFSGELLQAMLGLTPVPGDDESSSASKSQSGSLSRTMSERVFGPPASFHKPSTSERIADKSFADTVKVYSLGKEYTGLSVGAQQIIVAGKVGKAVTPVEISALGSLPEMIPEEGSTASSVGQSSTNKKEFTRFQVDENSPPILESLSALTSPTARLVRSMRRCGRKLLPILDNWTAVDVVMTRFEMVYFDATDDMEKTSECVREALAATHGGKGLRLCDIAAGRRVVGHLLLADVKTIHVSRELLGSREKEQDDVHCQDKMHVEFWHQKMVAMDHAWCKTKEDRLKIETIRGRTLYLRFYSDLDDDANHALGIEKIEESGSILKNNAFQWVQTIGRFCGPAKLAQSLPHFGDDNDDELRDYLIVHRHYHDGDPKANRFGFGRPTLTRLSPAPRENEFSLEQSHLDRSHPASTIDEVEQKTDSSDSEKLDVV